MTAAASPVHGVLSGGRIGEWLRPAASRRIVHVLAPGEVGGMETVVRLLARGQRDRGDRPLVLSVIEGEHHARLFRDGLQADGIEQASLVVPAHAYTREWRMVRDVCRREAPQVVHTHGFRADLVGGLAARQAGVATVSTVHGFTGGDWKIRFYERMNRLAFRRFHAVVAVSRPLADDLSASGISPDALHVIPNALDTAPAALNRAAARAELGLPAEGFCIGWIGRLSAEKAPDVMVYAMTALEHGELSVLGAGPQLESLRCEAAHLGVADRVHWHGAIAGAARLLPAFDVLALSSRTEGTPMVLLEAMAGGVPIVATRVGGVPDVVGDGEALLVPPDDAAALATAIETVRLDPHGARRRAEAARARLLEERGIERWLGRYDFIYDAAMVAAGTLE